MYVYKITKIEYLQNGCMNFYNLTYTLLEFSLSLSGAYSINIIRFSVGSFFNYLDVLNISFPGRFKC